MLKHDYNLGAKPFLKWAGGKSQLLTTIEDIFPPKIKKYRKIDKYFEVFVGGGALYFHLMNNFDVAESYIYDINPELILTYKVIKKDSKALIELLFKLQDEYIPLEQEDRKNYYLDIRSKFNEGLNNFNYEHYSDLHVTRASQIIFMNKTCFNGLFRLNKKGEFNVPHGRYKNPLICDEKNIKAVSKTLKNTHIINGNYQVSEDLIDEHLAQVHRKLIDQPSDAQLAIGNDALLRVEDAAEEHSAGEELIHKGLGLFAVAAEVGLLGEVTAELAEHRADKGRYKGQILLDTYNHLCGLHELGVGISILYPCAVIADSRVHHDA